MKVLLSKILAMFIIVASLFSLVNCGEEEDEIKKVYYGYYEFSDDLLDLYDIHVNIIDYDEFNIVKQISINKETPYKINEKSNSKSYLIRYDGTGKGSIYYQTIVKSKIDSYSELENSDKTYNIMYGYSFHKQLDSETDSEAVSATYYACFRETYTLTAKELSDAPKDSDGATKFDEILKSIEDHTNKKF